MQQTSNVACLSSKKEGHDPAWQIYTDNPKYVVKFGSKYNHDTRNKAKIYYIINERNNIYRVTIEEIVSPKRGINIYHSANGKVPDETLFSMNLCSSPWYMYQFPIDGRQFIAMNKKPQYQARDFSGDYVIVRKAESLSGSAISYTSRILWNVELFKSAWQHALSCYFNRISYSYHLSTTAWNMQSQTLQNVKSSEWRCEIDSKTIIKTHESETKKCLMVILDVILYPFVLVGIIPAVIISLIRLLFRCCDCDGQTKQEEEETEYEPICFTFDLNVANKYFDDVYKTKEEV